MDNLSLQGTKLYISPKVFVVRRFHCTQLIATCTDYNNQKCYWEVFSLDSHSPFIDFSWYTAPLANLSDKSNNYHSCDSYDNHNNNNHYPCNYGRGVVRRCANSISRGWRGSVGALGLAERRDGY